MNVHSNWLSFTYLYSSGIKMTNNEEPSNHPTKTDADDKTKNEHPVFEKIKESQPKDVVENVRNFFEVDGVSVEIIDGSGMTPLMHACWKGNLEFTKFLIKQVHPSKWNYHMS